MLKQILKGIGRQLLKVQWIKREVDAYKFEQQKRRHRENWSKIMRSGNSVRVDDKIVADYTDTRMVGHRPVQPLYIDSTNWGGKK